MAARTQPEAGSARYIGRDSELATLAQTLAEVNGSVARLVLISGEPGIGKTHLIRAYSDIAEASGVCCLFGNCDEDSAMPPYWPWLQIIRSMASRGTQSAPAQALADQQDFIRELLPADHAPAQKSTFTAEQPAQLEFRLFNKLTGHFIEYAQEQSLLLVFDNLHAADKQSLRLLEFLTAQVATAKIMIVGTYRDTAVTRKHPLSDSLSVLGRNQRLVRLRLKGLSRDAVEAIIVREVGQPISANAVDTIYERTDGNPLFVTEIARGLADELAQPRSGPVALQIPDGIREAIGRRLNHLPEDCTQMLGIASVIGRELLLAELVALAPERSGIEILQLLEPAHAAGILQLDEASTRLQFSHILIRDALFEELPMTRRLLLHRQFAEALQLLHADYLEPALGKIAWHYYRALQTGCVGQAVSFATLAAHHARQVLAFEEAATYYGWAIDALELDTGDHRAQAAELYLCLGQSHYAAGRNVGINRTSLEKAMELARACGHHSCFVDVVCEYVIQTLNVPTERTLGVCELALQVLPPQDTTSRARVLIHKSVALKLLGRRAEAERLVYQALALAEQCGCEKVLCEVLCWANFSLRGRPEMLSERISLGERCLEVATAIDNLAARVDAMKWLVLSCQEAGDTARVKNLAAEFKIDSEQHRTVHHRYVSAGVNAYCALMDGAWERAERLINEAYAVGRGSGDEGAEGVFGAQMFWLNRELGRLPAFAPVLQQFMRDAKQTPWPAGLACMLVEVGALDDAREVYRQLLTRGLDLLPRDEMFLATIALLGHVCCALRDTASAEDLYRRLLPYSGQMTVHPTAVCLGPVDLYLADLAAVAGHRVDALAHAERSLALAEQAVSPPWIAYAQFTLANTLGTATDAAKRQRGLALKAAALAGAESLGMARLIKLIQRTESAVPCAGASGGPDNLSPRELQVLGLIAAGRSNKEISRQLFISLNTVATHIRSIFQKIQVANRTEAAAYAFHHSVSDRKIPLS